MIEVFNTIIKERNWDDVSNTGMVQIMANIERRLQKRLPKGISFSLTSFQEKALQDKQFWRNWNEEHIVRHLMIQGATSAGKTLLSEFNILDTLHHRRQAIVLVPLKAMVHERSEQFRADMGVKYNVCGASSDHMEYDERLIDGDYDVAVIVYEKFFSMISQGSSKIMNNCGLLVVDELSMLNKEQRGPKLEMALEIVRGNCPMTRIMCLATSDCSTHKICEWLRIEKAISSNARPVSIEEHIIELNGEGLYRTIPADYDGTDDTIELQEEKLTIIGYRNDLTVLEKKRKLLLAVVDEIYKKQKNAKILIFVGTQSDASQTAQYLKQHCREWFPQLTETGDDKGKTEFVAKLKNCDSDDGQIEMIKELVPYGIAYHHAGVSTNLRELIEEEFQNTESFLKAIVATETLTVGVNMPFDAIIMVTSKVPRGIGDWVSLTTQEYRNYIGRAGRLGQNNRKGISYLFSENRRDTDKYWNSYYSREEIESSLTRANEEELAPYFLSLLTNRVGNGGGGGTNFTKEQLSQLYKRSLSHVCDKRRSINAAILQSCLFNSYLASDELKKARGRGGDGQIEYAVEGFGKHMAPYAFSTDTCISIFWYFCQGYLHCGLPMGITKNEIEEDRYLIDILYHVCRHKEIAESSVIMFPPDDRNVIHSFRAKKLVLDQLKKILSEKKDDGTEKYALWVERYDDTLVDESDLWKLLHSTSIADEDVLLQGAMRAIVLFYWTHGLTIKEIKEKTGFNSFTKMNIGDIERLAEVASFHLDAIHKCLSSSLNAEMQIIDSEETLSAFYALTTRVKYGMPRDLVLFANKHIHGLDRARLLALKKKADSCGLTPMQFLYTASTVELRKFISATQQSQLEQALERRGSVRKFDILMEIVSKDAGTKTSVEEQSCLKSIAEWDGDDADLLYESLKKVLHNDAFKPISISTDGNCNCIWLSLGNENSVWIAVVGRNLSADKKEKVTEFLKTGQEAGKTCLIVTSPINSENSEALSIFDKIYCHSIMDNIFLALILANTITRVLDDGNIFIDFLKDARGTFTKSDFRYFSLSHYIQRNNEGREGVAFRIVCNAKKEAYSKGLFDIGELEMALSKTNNGKDYEILSWKNLDSIDEKSFTDCPTILFLERSQIIRSNILNVFMHKMQNQKFRNCVLLLDSGAAEREWVSDVLDHRHCFNKWNAKYKMIQRHVVANLHDAASYIKQYLNVWNHDEYLVGISYSHYDSIDKQVTDGQSLLDQLADKLRDEYGEHRILYDQFSPAKELFYPGPGRTRSLEAYEKCRFFLVLWNTWTKDNKNCQEEMKRIKKKVDSGEAEVLFLQEPNPGNPDLPMEDYFPKSFTYDEIGKIMDTIKKYLAGEKDEH